MGEGDSSGVARGSGFSIVVAMDRARGIGKDGKLPWKLSGDMKFFKELTTCPDSAAVEKRWGLRFDASTETSSWQDVGAMLKFAHPLPASSEENGVIMGRKTFESLPANYRPLPDRMNAFLSRGNFSAETPDGQVHGYGSLDEALKEMGVESEGALFVIGGGQIFEKALHYQECVHLYVTEIDAVFPCDTFFPESPGFEAVLSSPWIEENGVRYRFRRYDRAKG
jgi:dihydrofolate reductase/thymidylate synthase